MYWTRRAWLGLFACWVIGSVYCPPVLCAEPAAIADEALLAEARQVHERALTLDSHVDIAGPQYATPQLDPGADNPLLKCDLVKMVSGGVDGVFFAAYVPQQACDADGYRRASEAAMAKISAIRRLTTMYPNRCALAATPDEVERIAAGGRRAIMIGIENGYAVGTELSSIQRFFDLGVRYITLCHNGHNQICDSCNPSSGLGDDGSKDRGLSPLGRQFVAEMNRLGMMIDLSHAAAGSFRDVVGLSRAPVIASHSGCAALREHPRNLTDEQLKTLAAKGGVIQMVAVGGFLMPPSPERKKAIDELAASVGVTEGNFAAAAKPQRERFEQEMVELDRRYPPACLKDFADHIDHAVQLAGVDHVGIGSDFDGGGGIHGFGSHAESLHVTVELLRRGYSADAIAKIWGGNLLRVWREVQAVAAR
ncbi:MAG: membrane dipeptidase [Pirellulales bacterium]|nr:membrane dipeptidase [Pirellulales bacterium]